MPTRIYVRTKEHNRKLSEILTGRKLSKEHKKNLGINAKESWQNEEIRNRRMEAINKPEVKQKRSKATKKAMNRPEVKEKHRKAIKIALNKPKTKQKHKETIKMSWNKPGIREKKSKIMKEIINKPGMKEKISKNTKKGMTKEGVSEKIRTGLIKYMQTHKGPFKNTDIEKIMYKALRKEKYKIKRWQSIGGFANVDFYLPEYNLIIECDGNYWHNLPGRQKHDRIITKKLKKLGYNVIRFWGDDIKKDLNSCLKRIGGCYG